MCGFCAGQSLSSLFVVKTLRARVTSGHTGGVEASDRVSAPPISPARPVPLTDSRPTLSL